MDKDDLLEKIPLAVSALANEDSKDIFKGIYRETTALLPNNNNDELSQSYTPSKFDGPKRKANRFHSFPRFGYTNDITSLVSFRQNPEGGGGGEAGSGGMLLSKLEVTNVNLNVTADTQDLIGREIPTLSDTEYDAADADDYIRGIAAAGILILCIYIIWGAWLVLLRVGRMDCCFRCCRKCLSGGGDRSSKSKRRAKKGYPPMQTSVGDEEDDEDEIGGKECCCLTCHETLAAKGGCCSRHIFCGWMAGRPPRLPTKQSLIRESELKNKSLVVGRGMKLSDIPEGIETVGGLAKSVVSKNNNGDDAADGQDEEAAVTDKAVDEAETAVIVAKEGDEDVANENDASVDTENYDESAENSPIAPGENDDDILITDEYIHKRQKAARRTILTLRIIFLFASIVVLCFSIVLMVKGWKGVNGIVNGSQQTLQLIDSHLERMMGDIEDYIDTQEELKVKRVEFVSRLKSTFSDSGGNDNSSIAEMGWCPTSAVEVGSGDGKVEIVLSLSQLLLRGKLIKLAFVDRAVDGEIGRHRRECHWGCSK